MTRYVVDCRAVGSFADFVTAMNAGFIRRLQGEWTGNLDALHDYLSWPSEQEYELELLGSFQCARALGHEAQAAWLRQALPSAHTSGMEAMTRRLVAAERGEGPTLFATIREIVERHDVARVHLLLQ